MEAQLAGNNDMKAAEGTYSSFLVFLKWGTIVTVITAAIVVLIIA